MADFQERGDSSTVPFYPHRSQASHRTHFDRRYGVRTARIGFIITLAGATFQTDKVFVSVLIFAFTGMLATEIVDRAERKFDKWRPKVGAE